MGKGYLRLAKAKQEFDTPSMGSLGSTTNHTAPNDILTAKNILGVQKHNDCSAPGQWASRSDGAYGAKEKRNQRNREASGEHRKAGPWDEQQGDSDKGTGENRPCRSSPCLLNLVFAVLHDI